MLQLPPAESPRAVRSQRRRVRQLQQRQRREDRALLAELARRVADERPALDDGPPPRID